MREYSHSQLEKYETCPLQYKFVYVDRLRRYEEGVEAFLGSRFHETMQFLYKEREFRVVPLEELLAFYEKAWADKWHAAVRIRKEGRTADEYRLLGRRCVEDYYRRHHPFDEGHVLGLERMIRFPLDAPLADRHQLHGRHREHVERERRPVARHRRMVGSDVEGRVGVDPAARALFLFPTKALEQDQLKSLQQKSLQRLNR